MTWQPRYVAYCYSQGELDPSHMLETDRERWPGGVMCGFILWIQEQWRVYRKLNNLPPNEPVSEAHHENFDTWLSELYVPLRQGALIP